MGQHILRLRDVVAWTGLSRSTLYAMIAEGSFPRPVLLGKRAVGWRETDVSAWLGNLKLSGDVRIQMGSRTSQPASFNAGGIRRRPSESSTDCPNPPEVFRSFGRREPHSSEMSALPGVMSTRLRGRRSDTGPGTVACVRFTGRRSCHEARSATAEPKRHSGSNEDRHMFCAERALERNTSMYDAERITRALGGHWHGLYGMALCPAHENTATPSLSLSDGHEGQLLAKCFAGCCFAEILSALRARGLSGGSVGTASRDPSLAPARRAGDPANQHRNCPLQQRKRRAEREVGDLRSLWWASLAALQKPRHRLALSRSRAHEERFVAERRPNGSPVIAPLFGSSRRARREGRRASVSLPAPTHR